MDENRRRYYLELMGIQCWEARDGAAIPPDDLSIPEASAELAAENSVAENTVDVTDADPVTGWPALESRIQQCHRCGLAADSQIPVCGHGKHTAGLMIVLMSVSEVFSQPANKVNHPETELLGKMLSAIDIAINDVYITTLLKCKFPDNHTVTVSEVECCMQNLQQEIGFVRPDRLLVMGEQTARCLLQKNMPLDSLRDSNQEMLQVFNVPLMVTYSPQELLADSSNKRKAWLDLQYLQTVLKH